jgi:transcriptional repressor NrdR
MRCPFCGNVDTQVKDSRPAEDHVAIRRRRFCPACGGRFTTYERVQLRDLVVIKSNGKREDFDRDKLERSVRIALQKRPVEPERIDQMISGIVRRLESMGETDIASKTIGEIVMERLAAIDTVAYVRLPAFTRTSRRPTISRISWRSFAPRFSPAPEPCRPRPTGVSWPLRCRWGGAVWAGSGRTPPWDA